MSRSIRKHTIVKYACDTRWSWKNGRTFVNRYNRRVAKRALHSGEDCLPRAKKLCAWDWDYCKWYISKKEAQKYYKLKRK